MAGKVQFYEDNILNGYDNVTYNWTMYMVRPEDVNKYDQVINSNNVKIIAQSGVEAEINIQSVQQNLKLAFNKQAVNREAVANVFSFNLVEPGGATLYTRIAQAAQDLGIVNHLKAAYLLELKFIGYEQDGAPTQNITPPYYWMCTMTALDFAYSEGATQYRADLIETTQDAFKKLILTTKQDMTVAASTFGGFLEGLQKQVNIQEDKQVANSSGRSLSHDYVFGVTEKASPFLEWSFGASPDSSEGSNRSPGDPRPTGENTTAGNVDLGNVSVTGTGNLTFTIPKGTRLTDLIVMALFQTTEYRKLPTDEGGFHKDNPDDAKAKATTWKDLSQWIVFDTDTVYQMYDPIARDWAKEITINVHAIAVPELHHDVDSYEEVIKNKSIQKERLQNIIRKDLLKKRFDYYHTGLNTEVLNLDIYLNTTYYQIQALNQGAGRFVANTFGGEGTPGSEFNIKKTALLEINEKINAQKALIRENQGQLKNLQDDLVLLNPNEAKRGESKIETVQQDIKNAKEEIKTLEASKGALEDQVILLEQQVKAENRVNNGAFNNQTGRYLTQSELFGVNKNNEEYDNFPLTHDIAPINSKATNGPDEGDTAGAVFLGAVELNLESLGDLVQQQITVRGDPYWLGRPKSRKATLEGADYTRGGVSYFLNLDFPTYPDQDTGLMRIPEANYGIVGLFRVHTVDASYSEGQFTMTLQSYRDTNTNVGMMWEYLNSGEIDMQEEKQRPALKTPEEQGEGEQSGSETEQQPGPSLGEVEDGDVANPNVIESQINSSGTIRNQAIKPELKSILQTAADNSGLSVVVYSGGQPDIASGGNRTGTTRHDNGAAADIRIQNAAGRNLSLSNPADVPLIQNFLAEAKRAGATGIGAGNGYMGNNGFHVDIAKQFGQAPGGSAYWGGLPDASGRIRAKNAPQFLKDIMLG